MRNKIPIEKKSNVVLRRIQQEKRMIALCSIRLNFHINIPFQEVVLIVSSYCFKIK